MMGEGYVERNADMRQIAIALAALLAFAATSAQGQIKGDAKRGAESYRACVGCHSLETGSHLSGPSLAGLWGRKAGRADGFVRYSKGLKSAEFMWDENTLNVWLANPRAMIPGTYMVFRGVENERARTDLVAFLAIAMAPGGAKAAVEQKLVPYEYVRGQKPSPLSPALAAAQVTKIRHCRDSYFVTTADGAETPFWEMNVRLKLDSTETGPAAGKPVIHGAGMQGDRVSIVFSSLKEITRFIAEAC